MPAQPQHFRSTFGAEVWLVHAEHGFALLCALFAIFAVKKSKTAKGAEQNAKSQREEPKKYCPPSTAGGSDKKSNLKHAARVGKQLTFAGELKSRRIAKSLACRDTQYKGENSFLYEPTEFHFFTFATITGPIFAPTSVGGADMFVHTSHHRSHSGSGP